MCKRIRRRGCAVGDAGAASLAPCRGPALECGGRGGMERPARAAQRRIGTMRTLGDYHDTSDAISLNDRAAVLAEELVARAAELSVAVHRLANGATVVDCGARTIGSHEAGRIYAEACMG